MPHPLVVDLKVLEHNPQGWNGNGSASSCGTRSGAGSGGYTGLLAWAHRASTTAAHITCMCGPREGRGAGAGNRLKRGGDGRQRDDEERPDRWAHTNQYISTCSRLVSSTLRRQINFVKDVLDLLHCEPIDKFSDVNVHFESLKI
jgi:hypothetical protein